MYSAEAVRAAVPITISPEAEAEAGIWRHMLDGLRLPRIRLPSEKAAPDPLPQAVQAVRLRSAIWSVRPVVRAEATVPAEMAVPAVAAADATGMTIRAAMAHTAAAAVPVPVQTTAQKAETAEHTAEAAEVVIHTPLTQAVPAVPAEMVCMQAAHPDPVSKAEAAAVILLPVLQVRHPKAATAAEVSAQWVRILTLPAPVRQEAA